MAVLPTGLSEPPRGYEIANSCRFNDDDSAYLSRTPASAGNRKTWTWSGWVKKAAVDAGQIPIFGARSDVSNRFMLYFNDGTADDLNVYVNVGGTATALRTNAYYRDPAASLHIVLAMDTTQATAANRLKLYVNGTQITSFAQESYPAQNAESPVNNTVAHYFADDTASDYLDGYLSEVHFIDGQALSPTNFGEFDDTYTTWWKPKSYTGTYGTNGFYLDFKNSASLGNDVSGNNNDWTATNLAATDQMLDTPTNVFATLNPLTNHAGETLSEGNLKVATGSSQYGPSTSSIAVSSGKYYCELTLLSGAYTQFGCANSSAALSTTTGLEASGAEGFAYCQNDGSFRYEGTTVSGYGATWTTNDIIGMALNLDDNQVTFYKNGVSQGVRSITGGRSYVVGISDNNAGGASTAVMNFGQDSSFAGNKIAQGNADGNGYGDFYYSPPSGYLALCSQNLSDSAVVPEGHFNTVLYTGNGSNDYAITGVGFQPDFVWLKSRSIIASSNLADTIRGCGKILKSDVTEIEYNWCNQYSVQSFDSDGFTLKGAGQQSNQNAATYVAWNWKMGGTGVSNTNGTITSTVSANTSAGMSVVSYTGNGTAGATVGHGIGTPALVIIKNRTSGATDWPVFHKDATRLKLNTTDADYGTYGVTFGATTITLPSVDDLAWSASSNNYIMYVFEEIEGFSKIGSYTGNGSADGPFVYTGFRPAFILFKKTNTSEAWKIYHNKVAPYNPEKDILAPDLSDAEGVADNEVDFLSNGFKLRTSWNGMNGSSDDYIFLAFAESEFKRSNGL